MRLLVPGLVCTLLGAVGQVAIASSRLPAPGDGPAVPCVTSRGAPTPTRVAPVTLASGTRAGTPEAASQR